MAGDDGELDVAANGEQLLCPGQVGGLAGVEGEVGERREGGAGGQRTRTEHVTCHWSNVKMEACDWSIVTEVALQDAAVAVKLVVCQSRGKEV